MKQEMQDFKLVTQVYAARGSVLQIVREVLKDHAVQEEQTEVKVLGWDHRPRCLSGHPPVASSRHSRSHHFFRQLLPRVFRHRDAPRLCARTRCSCRTAPRVFVFTALLPFPLFPQEIVQLTEAAIKKVLENYVLMPDWAQEAIGM